MLKQEGIVIIDPFCEEKDSPLRIRSQRVDDVTAERETILDLHKVLDVQIERFGRRRGIGVSAPQIGRSAAIAIVDFFGERIVLINPEIKVTSQEERLSRIGCLSFFAYRALIRHPERITVEFQDETGQKKIREAKGDEALILMHEIDHLEGRLAFDRLKNGANDLFIPREKQYTSQHVPLKNYGFMLMMRRFLKLPQKIQTATEYYSLLFNDVFDYKKYIEESKKKRSELYSTIKKYTRQGGRIFEAGCGTSALSIALSREGYDVTCTDLDADMRDLAARMNLAAGGRVTYRNENILNIKENNDAFDLVFSHGVLEHFNEEDIILAINEGLRIAPIYIVSVPTIYDVSNNLLGDENLWSIKKWEKIIAKSAGYIHENLGSFPFHPRIDALNKRLSGRIKRFAPVTMFVLKRK